MNKTDCPNVPKKEINQASEEKDIVFETFHHSNGRSYCCMRAHGQRYYLDSTSSGQWQLFPQAWMKQGRISSDEPQATTRENSTQSWEEERVEYVNVPGRGKMQTQIFETRTRVHCYFDTDEATWLRLPISWELYSPAARHLVDLVKDVCPTWTDDSDILAALRVSNYNVDDCVNTYHSSVGKDPQAIEITKLCKRPSKNCKTQEMGDKVYEELTNMIESLKGQLVKVSSDLSREKSAHEKLKRQVSKNSDIKPYYDGKPNTHQICSQQIWKYVMDSKQFCQDIRESLTGSKRIIEGFVSTLIPLLKRLDKSNREKERKLADTMALYRLEVQQRRLTYNALIELRGNIRVFCRIRPIPGEDPSNNWLRCNDFGELFAYLPNSTKRRYQFDNVFDTNATQEDIFQELKDIITSSVDGYNVCIMAYGQTGSGKTYTMEGPLDKPGVNILSIRELLRIIKKRSKVDFELSMSILEIYNETVVDLLSPMGNCEPVEIRHTSTSVNVVGATWIPVDTEEDMYTAIAMGQRGRHMAATKLNSNSSRSHLIVTVSVIGTDRISGAVSRGKLTLCDLAGSERIEKSGPTSGERFQEATHINLSLSALAQVFVALKNNQLHIPYRNAKLTQMLQPCLGGEAKTCLIVTISSDPACMSETLSSLQFGTSARQVVLGPARPHLSSLAH